MHHLIICCLVVSVSCTGIGSGSALAADAGLVGYWKLQGDCQDYSGNKNHGVSHGAGAVDGRFDGYGDHVEVPDSPSLGFGSGNFSLSALIHTQAETDDVYGDILSKFDRQRRQGFNLTFVNNTSGYNSPSDLRQLFFGVDDGTTGEWIDCGHPGGKSHCSDALTVFDGDLYVGTTDAPDPADWARVYRYRGGHEWEDCGRVGRGTIRGVYAMIAHNGALYAATASSHGGPNVNVEDFGRVYRYRGSQEWEDIGQPGEHYRINSLASFRGKLYALAINTGGTHGGVYVHEGGQTWTQCGDFGRPHTSGVHNGRLYAAFPQGEVFAYDGITWENLGNPFGTFEQCNQLHSHGVYRGELYVGTWPMGKVALWRDDQWLDVGRLGDATEIVGLTVYNGSFYGGSIPRAEVFRFDGPERWTSVGRLFDFRGVEPLPVGNFDRAVEDWTRASSLTVYQGKLFSSTATCYRAMITEPREDENRGRVYSFATGMGLSLDRDLGAGWKHVAAVRDGRTMKLYVDGQLVASNESEIDPLDVSNDAPLEIGFGPQSHWCGKIREVRLYNRALEENEVQALNRETAAASVN
ncbi:MAG: LamG-like jellyroll fold domain-containing protein [Pirellulales bacterium]